MTAEIVPYEPQELEYVPRFVLDPVQAKELDTQLRQSMRAVLVENHDYGKIPGADKPSLWQPGAEKLLQWFGFGFTMDRIETERDSDGQRHGVTYRATVIKELPGRRITVAASDGYAGYDEEKFYQSAETLKAKAEKKERYWAERDGRQPNPAKWEYQVYADYRAPWNTIIKMAQKRALVSAAKDATAAGALFTEDIEDTPDASPPATQAETAPQRPRKGQRSAAGGEARNPAPAAEQTAAAGAVPGPPMASRGQAAAIEARFLNLGYADTPDDKATWMRITGRLAGYDGELRGIARLTAEQAASVLRQLQGITGQAELQDLLSDGVKAQDEARDGE